MTPTTPTDLAPGTWWNDADGDTWEVAPDGRTARLVMFANGDAGAPDAPSWKVGDIRAHFGPLSPTPKDPS